MVNLILYFIVAIIVSFICSLVEAVLLSLSHAHIALLIEKGRPSGRILQGFKDKINYPLAAILTINTVANTVGAALVGAQALYVFGSGWVAIFSGLLTFCILLFSEIIPKTIGAVYWKKLAPAAAHMIRVLVFITWPLVVFLVALSRRIAAQGRQTRVTREEMLVAAEMGRAEGVLLDRERSVIRNLLKLNNITVREVMTPRSVLFALSEDKTVAEVLKEHFPIRFSRIPVFGKDLDDITGLIRRFQLAQAMSQNQTHKKLSEIKSPIKAVPETKSVAAVLEAFIMAKREHLFLVVDEYGGTAGIITLEDAIETLLGVEIIDELDSVDDMQKYALEQWEKKQKEKQPL